METYSGLKICPFCGVKLLEPLNTLYYVVQHPNNDCVLSGWHDSIGLEYKDDLIDRWNRRATGWIAVEDGLPENIISWNNGHKESLPLLGYCPEIYPRVRRVIYYPERTRVYESHWRLEEQKHTRDSVKVTHWQPLPSPPEEKK